MCFDGGQAMEFGGPEEQLPKLTLRSIEMWLNGAQALGTRPERYEQVSKVMAQQRHRPHGGSKRDWCDGSRAEYLRTAACRAISSAGNTQFRVR